jgi:hypothetical protein
MAVSLSVIIGDLDVCWSGRCPNEADTPLIVDTDAVLAFAVALQLFEPVAGRDAQIVDGFSGIKEKQLSVGRSLQIWSESAHMHPLPYAF